MQCFLSLQRNEETTLKYFVYDVSVGVLVCQGACEDCVELVLSSIVEPGGRVYTQTLLPAEPIPLAQTSPLQEWPSCAKTEERSQYLVRSSGRCRPSGTQNPRWAHTSRPTRPSASAPESARQSALAYWGEETRHALPAPPPLEDRGGQTPRIVITHT